MECADVLIELESYLIGETPSELSDAIATHLRGCASCAAECADLEPLLSTLPILTPEPIQPDFDLAAAVISQARSVDSASKRKRRSKNQKSQRSQRKKSASAQGRFPQGLILAIALSIALALLLTLYTGQNKQNSDNTDKPPKPQPQPVKTDPRSLEPLPTLPRSRRNDEPAAQPHLAQRTRSDLDFDQLLKPEAQNPPPTKPEQPRISPPKQDNPKPAPETQVTPDLDPTILATVIQGADRLKVNGKSGQTSVKSGDKVTVKKGSRGIQLSFDQGVTLLLSAGAEAHFDKKQTTLTAGQALLDLRDARSGTNFKSTDPYQLSPGTRVLFAAGGQSKPRRLDLLNGEIQAAGQAIAQGTAIIWKKGQPRRTQVIKAEPRWCLKTRAPFVTLYDLEADWSNAATIWERGQLTTLRKKRALLAEPAKDKTHDYVLQRKPVAWLFKHYKGTYAELTVIATKDCEVQFRLFDATRQDNYDTRIKIRRGAPRKITLALEDLKAADNSGTPLGEGHLIIGTALLIHAAENPNLHLLSYRVIRLSVPRKK